MPIAPTFEKYLASKHVEYDVITHDPTNSSLQTAQACCVSGDRLAKAVVLRDAHGYVLAVIPATHHIRLSDLRRQLGFDIDMASEHEIEELFDDCVRGAVPPIGECYGLDMVVDDSIDAQPHVYLEAGDHATVVHLNQAQFAALMATAQHGRFSVHN